MNDRATFRSQLLRELRGFPWWATSLAVHVILMQAFFTLPLATHVPRERTAVILPTFEEEILLDEECRPEIIEGEIVESMVVEPLGEIGHSGPIAVDRPGEYGRGFISDAPFEGPSTNAAIGIGGGAGGAFGGRGGHRNLKAMGCEFLVIEQVDGEEREALHNGRPVTQGALFAEDDAGRELGEFPLRHTNVDARLSGFVSSVDVTQSYENTFDRIVEAVYVFPLPRTSAVNGFTMTVGDRTIVAVIRERDEARRVYEQAKKDGLVASLLTQERPNIFTQKVANLEPGRKVDVTIRYFHRLRAAEGGYEFVFPMVVGPRYIPGRPGSGPSGGTGWSADTDQVPDASRITPPPVARNYRSGHDVSIAVSIDAGVDLVDVESPTHAIEVDRPEPSRANVRLEKRLAIPNKDFVLRYRVLGGRPSFGLLAHRAERGGFFALMMTPKADVRPEEATPREMVFVLDCSGSMRGDPLAKAKAVVHRFLEGMGSQDTFRVIRFSSSASGLSDAPLAATAENRERGRKYVDSLTGCGGTGMLSGMKAALDPAIEPGRLRFVCFLTDGFIGNETSVLSAVRTRLKGARLFSFGVGSGPNRYLLDKLAEEGRGAVQYVLPKTPAADAANEFFRRLESPYLTDMEIDFGGIPVREVSPARVPDVFAGRPGFVTGRYEGGGATTVRVRGRVGGRPFLTEIPVEFPEWEEGNDGLASIWARTRIEKLMDSMVGGITKEGKDEVTRLALEYGLVSPFTALTAVDRSRATSGESVTITVPVHMPAGVSYRGVFGSEGDFFELAPLGVHFSVDEGGLTVTRIVKGSPAELAGIEEGHRILVVNGRRVSTGREAEEAAETAADRVTLGAWRDGRRFEVSFLPR